MAVGILGVAARFLCRSLRCRVLNTAACGKLARVREVRAFFTMRGFAGLRKLIQAWELVGAQGLGV